MTEHAAQQQQQKPISSIKLPRQRRRDVSAWLLAKHPLHRKTDGQTETAEPINALTSIVIVCISDTHNEKPPLPFGDVLIHAGDLTENGSFAEYQDSLDWLSSQPHPFKVLIAGNHDAILDDEFLDRYPERRCGDARSREQLDWGSVMYLQDSSVTLIVRERKLRIFGSPWTPCYGVSAFQYPRDEDVWQGKIPNRTDVVVTHGPPYLHLDKRDFHRAGCQFLGSEVCRVRPRLVVFGNIHAGYGRESVVLDRAKRKYEEIVGGWRGWQAVLLMAFYVVVANVESVVMGARTIQKRRKTTAFVNAAVAGGRENDLRNEPIVAHL